MCLTESMPRSIARVYALLYPSRGLHNIMFYTYVLFIKASTSKRDLYAIEFLLYILLCISFNIYL